MTPMAHAISVALLHFVWQGLAIAFLLWVTLTALGRGSARLRYAASCAALAVMSALPFITTYVIYRALGATPPRIDQVVNIANTTDPALLAATSSLPHWLAALEVWALPVWSAGVLVFAIRLIRSSRYVAKLRREGEPAGLPFVDAVSRLARRMGIVRPLRVLTSGLAGSPGVVGWLKPVILLPPAALMNLSTSQLEAVLAHELAHIRRHDYLANLLQTVVETLFFYQPAIWWVSSRIRHERELCCDDLVVEICGDPVGYARALTQLERSRVASPELAMMSTASPLMYRIQRLTGVGHRQPSTGVSAAFAVGLAVICFMMNVHWAKAQPLNGSEAEVQRGAIWVDTVKFGDLPIAVAGAGSMTTATTAKLNVPAPLSDRVQIGETASIALARSILVAGKVTHVDSRTVNGTVPVTVQLQAPMSEFAGQSVDGIIQITTLNDVVYVGRPVDPETTIFKLESDGQHSMRVKVRFGASSVNKIQVLEGLRPGDRVILSDMSKYHGYDRVRLK